MPKNPVRLSQSPAVMSRYLCVPSQFLHQVTLVGLLKMGLVVNAVLLVLRRTSYTYPAIRECLAV